MNGNEFLKRLEDALGKLPEPEKSEVLRFYTEYIDDAEREGDASAIENIGSPEELAEEVLSSFAEKDKFDSKASGAPKPESGSQTTLPRFRSISADLRACTVTIKRGDAGKIQIKNPEGSGRITYGVEDDTLEIEQQQDRVRFSWFKPHIESTRLSHITITLTDADYDEFDLHTVNGNISLSGLRVKDADLETVVGGIELCDMRIGTLSAESVNGAVSLSDVKTRKADLENVNGSFSIESFECETLNIENVNGSVTVTGDISGRTRIETVNGSIRIRTKKPASCYDWNMSALGSAIVIDGEKHMLSAKKNTGAANKISCETVVGSVTLDFGGEHGEF